MTRFCFLWASDRDEGQDKHGPRGTCVVFRVVVLWWCLLFPVLWSLCARFAASCVTLLGRGLKQVGGIQLFGTPRPVSEGARSVCGGMVVVQRYGSAGRLIRASLESGACVRRRGRPVVVL